MRTIKDYARSPDNLALLVLSALTLSNVLLQTGKLEAFRDFSSHVLANSVMNVSSERSMDLSVVPGYLMVTFSVNYIVSILLRRPNPFRVAAFCGVLLIVSAAVSIASTSSYLGS